MLESVNLLKKSLCNMSLTILEASAPPSIEPLTYGLVTFCKTNDTLLEVLLLTINQVGHSTSSMFTLPLTHPQVHGRTPPAYPQFYVHTPLTCPQFNSHTPWHIH